MAELSIAYDGLLSDTSKQNVPYFEDTLPIQYKPANQPDVIVPPKYPPRYINVIAEEEHKHPPKQTVTQEIKYLSSFKPILQMPDIVRRLEKELASTRKVKEEFVSTSNNPKLLSIILIILVALSLHLFIKKFINYLAEGNPKHELVIIVFYPILFGFILWVFFLKGKPAT